MAPTAKLRWTKCPPDGTNYSYWEAPGGWVICTKQRFLPRIGYGLEVPPSSRPGTCLRFNTLAEAQAAAQWPREQLITALREAYESLIALLVGTSCSESVLLALHERALEDDRERFDVRVVCG